MKYGLIESNEKVDESTGEIIEAAVNDPATEEEAKPKKRSKKQPLQ